MIIIHLAFVLISCTGHEPITYITDLQQANINGRVQRAITETFVVDSISGKQALQSVTVEIFDTQGFTVTDTTKDLPGNRETIKRQRSPSTINMRISMGPIIGSSKKC